MPGERRRLRVWPIALVATVALAAAWLGAHHLREVPPDPFADESFAPVVSVTPVEDGLQVVAGGAVAGAIPPGTAARIAAVLDHPGNRARWIAHARRGLR